MASLKSSGLPVVFLSLGSFFLVRAQEPAPSAAAKPTEHVLGTVSAVDKSAHSITIKEDKTGAEHIILLENTKTLIKVPPGAKDLKAGSRITEDDLAVGDRVDIRGSKPPDNPDRIAARSVVLMSGRDLQQVHQAQAAEWQHSTAGVVDSIEPATGKVLLNVRTPAGPKQIALETSPSTEFMRYSPQNPGSPAASRLSDILPGDQVRVIGDRNEDGSSIKAQKIYSGAFRTLNGTVSALGADGKSLTVKDLATKKPIEITLSDQTMIHRLPPAVAAGLAHRSNPGARTGPPPSDGQTARQGPPPGAGAPPSGSPQPDAASGGAGHFGGTGVRRNGNGDISQMIDQLPKISLSDLKPGDALVISGVVTDAASGQLLANNIIAGVEPILQSAPAGQRGAATGGDWGLGEMTAPQ